MDLNDIKLNNKENTRLGIQAAIQAIPYVGSSIATLYFGYKQEIRFKRLETFYKSISNEIEGIKDKIKGNYPLTSSINNAIIKTYTFQ